MSFFTSLQVLLLIATILPSPSLSVAEFECEEEWELIGTHCYRFVDVRLNYEDSVKACERYGAQLLYIRDEIETATLASRADDVFESASEFWIANIRDPLCRGYWLPYEPKEDIEGQTAVASNMDGRWRLALASDRMPFVCRTPACPEDFFRCSDGKCLHNNWKCDGEYDCDDQSDENDCGDCAEYLTGNSGSIDTEDTYPNKTVCQWIIEGDPGEVLKLEFEVFDIEPDVDVLTIYVGGPTLQTSVRLEEMTGTIPANSKTVYSYNNFFILRLTTDGTVSRQGIKATWSAVPELKLGEITTLEASDMYQMFTSPFYDDENVPMFMTKEWLITAPTGEVITVEVLHSTLDENDMVFFSKKGVIFETPEENTTLVVSQTNNFTIIINARHEENIRFKARFKKGCSIDSSFLQASLAIEDMPADLNCVWNISNPKSLSFTISFTNYSFDDPDDFIKVFGATELGENELMYLHMNSSVDEVVDIGSNMIIQYFSNALRPRNRVTAMIASKCPDFPNSDFMETAGTIQAGQSYSLNISCETGYELMQEEYNRDGFVIADCSALGDWFFGSISYTRYPSCQIVYCGIPEQIQNGIIIDTSGNVTFQGTAEYDCFNGFTLQGSETITCQSDGSWTEPPSCEAEPCDSVPQVDDADYIFVTGGASLSFGTIVHYSCEPGFDVIGAPQIVCGSNGTWSHEAPQCRRLSCSIPHVEHGNYSSDSILPVFEDQVLLTCDWGYKIDGTDLQSAQTECGPDRVLLNESLSCVDRNECDEDPCGPSEVCVNHPGNFTCLCISGYSGSPCEKTLDPYDHCGLFCGDSVLFYCCNCMEGYEIFTENGTNGFYIPSEETGLRDLDVYHIDVTCVPKQCSMPPANHTVGEPFLITAKTIHHYEDELQYFCDFGYALPLSNDSAICNSLGVFEGDVTDQNCSRLMCPLPPTGNELELSRSPENGTIPPEGTVNITCLKGDGTTNTVIKRLFCAPTVGNPGEFSLQGDNPECLKIDCLMPEESPGSMYIFHQPSTEFGASFEFTCNSSKGFSVSGSSSDGTQNVSCLASGRWGFGNLTCSGVQCQDPGFNAGTRYSAPEGFAIDQLVHYDCLNPTYTLVPSGPRICEFENGNATWNGSVPVCVDQRPPEISCTQPPEFNLYDELIYQEVTATDNSGFVVVYQTSGPLSSSLVTDPVVAMDFLASDGSYETGCCIYITLTDLTPPMLSCQTAYLEINQSDSVALEQIVSSSSHFNLVQLSHNLPIDDRPGSAVGVRASVTKPNGLMRECATLVQVAYPSCTNESIANPRNGTISNCREEDDFYKCDIQCHEGFLLPDFNVSYTGQCQDGVWTPSPSFFNCYETFPTIQLIQITEVFEASSAFGVAPAAPLDECIGSHLEKMTTLIEGLSGVCGSATFSVENIQGEEAFFFLVVVDMTIRITGISEDELPACLRTLNETAGLLDPTDEPTAATGDCKTPWTINVNREQRSSEIRAQECDINGIVHTLDDNTTRCVPCGPGYKFDGESCQACEPGTYNPLPGRTECQACPYNGGISPTLGSKAISVEDCEEICPPGFVSGTGYVTGFCMPCDVGLYWENAFTCTPCPNDGSTKGIEAAVDVSYCYDPCQPGTYSLSGYEDCTSCPMNFYSDDFGSTRCTQCPSDTYTDSEGSISASACLNGSALCTDDFCSSSGAINCSVIDHRPRCLCLPGYSGDQCDTFHNPCDVTPCYNSATCIPEGLSYSCDCPKERNCTFELNNTLADPGNDSPNQIIQPQDSLEDCQTACTQLDSCLGLFFLEIGGSGLCALQTELTFDPSGTFSSGYIKICDDTPLFAGEHCEEDLTNDCTESSCSNEDFCKDLVGGTECICPPGGAYQQPRCEPSSNPCEDSPCDNGAICEAYGSVRRICFCRPGFTGENCSVNIDDCDHNSEGCLYGGDCLDGEESYSCDCPGDFGGGHCEERADLCESASCGENGACISDYHLMRALCFCGDHYELAENTTDSCVPINYCEDNPCEHNATCNNFIGGYDCDCLPGFEGSQCQQSIDDCATSPCQNEGVCHDKLNDFECICPPGFQGKMCETNIEDCNGQCVSANTVTCENLVLGYKCNCRDGFKGKNCNDTIMLCDDEPCRHGGNCTDLIDSFDFSCACPNGWTGKTCEDIDNYCAADPCQNQAQCYNLIDRTYCDCEDGTAGLICETRADVCGLFSPFACLHGECSHDDSLPSCKCFGAITSCEFEDTQKIVYETEPEFVLEIVTPASLDECEDACENNSTCVAFVYSSAVSFCQLRKKYELGVTDTDGVQRIKTCQYDPHYSGKSCQLQKDQCYNNTCGLGENTGQCLLDGLGYTCDCEEVENFEGPQCQTPVEVCQPSSCPGVTTCYQYMDDDGYLQPVCLCGADEILSGNICKSVDRNFDLAFPPGLSRNNYVTSQQGFFMGFEGEITITFWVACLDTPDDWVISIASADQDPESAEYDPYIEIHNQEVIFTETENISLPQSLDKDFQWHFIRISIDQEGQYVLQFDFLTPRPDGQQLSIPFPHDEYLLIHLGQSFTGYISQVSVWKSVLSVNEGVLMAGDSFYVPEPNTLALGWTLYSLNVLVQQVYPSSAEQTKSVCTIDGTLAREETCPGFEFPDKMPPMLLAETPCQPEQTLLLSIEEHQETINRLGYRFSDGMTSSNIRGDVFSYGAHDIAVVSEDSNGNIGVCMTRTYVTPNRCEDTRPSEEFEDCDDNNNTVSVECPDNQFPSTPQPHSLTCGKLGSYNLEDMFQRPPRIVCGECLPITFSVTLEIVYTLPLECPSGSIGSLSDQVELLIKAISEEKWDRLCVDSECSNADISAECSDTEDTEADVTIVLEQLPAILNSSDENQLPLTPRELMLKLVEDGDDLDASDVFSAQLKEDDFSIDERPQCLPGHVISGDCCVQCGEGSFHDVSDDVCRLCPVNYFTNSSGQTECTPCPGNNATLQEGSSSVDDCVARCSPGEYLNMTTGMCDLCPSNFYQDLPGQISCKPCPPATGAESSGSTAENECQEYCPPGTQLNDAECVSCRRGFYRRGDIQDQCRECPENTTTANVGASGIDQCVIPICDPGTFVFENPINTYRCQTCDYGSYQNETSMFRCEDCLPMYTTASTGAIDESECVFVCPPGKEEDPDEPLTCRSCERGTYRGPSLGERFNPCQNCSGPFITDQVGSLYANQCIVAECLPGRYLNVSDNSCYECDYGTYQPLKWQTDCSMCDPSFTTEDTASDSSSDCRFVCPEGHYESSPGSETCEMCPRGTYRGSTLEERFLPCNNCSESVTTEGPGATEMSHCNITVCTAGSYRNETDNICRPCPKGQYQDEDLQLSCKSCNDDYTTNGTGKTSSNDCIFVCPEGSEVVGFETCELCGRGLYKNSSMEFDMCEPCSDGWTTDATGAVSSELCNIKYCQAGNILSNDFSLCIPCSVDSYQPIDEPDSLTTCTNCSANTGTQDDGSDDSADCITICQPGFGYNSSIEDCSICPQGFFNNGNLTMRFMACENCPSGFTTVVEEGATHESNCSLRDCPPGSYFNENDICVPCPVGTFQPERRQSMCEECPINKNTSTDGATDSSDCSIFCAAGKQDDRNDNCVECPPDYYKESASFDDCEQCEGDFTSGSDRISCTEVFCDIGRELNGSQCVECAVGFYKRSRGNDACDECPANTTTSSTGEIDSSACDEVFCVPGFFSADNETCEACAVGFYKDHRGNDECTPCSENTTTVGRASTQEDACFLKICPPGEYRSDDNNCLLCGIGFYQPMSGSTDCSPCDDGYFTDGRGSTHEDDCLIECPAGEYRNVSINECEECAIGYYQDLPNSVTCIECSGNFTTLSEGRSSQDDCQIQCPPGYLKSSSTQCLPCDRGLYQDEPNSMQCVPCERIDGYDVSTLDIASTSSDSCLPQCPPGLYLNITTKSCIQCAIGTFKTTVGLDTECETCPQGNTTLERGSINSLSCIYELCNAGFYREEGEPDCQECPLGQFQPNSGVMVTSCSDCPVGKTTLITGAEDEEKDCVTDCDDGQEYNVATENCHGCEVGFYRKKPNVLFCTLCPDGQTTLGLNSSQCVDTATEPRIAQIVIYKFNVTFSLVDCGNEPHITSIIGQIVSVLAQTSAARYRGMCQNDADAICDNIIVFIPVFCGLRRQRGNGIVKRQTGGTVIAEITASDIPDLVEDTENGDQRVPTSTVLEQLFVDLSPVEDTMDTNDITYESVDPAVLACSPGSVLSDQSDRCELCPVGQYHAQVSDVCAPCPKGSYSVESRLTCQSCPDGKTTGMEGSHDESSCDGECAFNSSLCGDHGQCRKNANDLSYCACNELYTGEACQSPVVQELDDGDDSDVIIGVCAGIGGLFLLILLIVFICSRGVSSKRSAKKKRRVSSDEDSGHDFKMPVYLAPPMSRSQQSNYLTFDPTMYQSDVIDIYQPQASSRDQASI